MTGDGAVVRVDHALAKLLADVYLSPDISDPVPNDAMATVSRAYLAQAAEIERLTYRLTLFNAIKAESIERREKLEASEARNADLLKALESLAADAQHVAEHHLPGHIGREVCESVSDAREVIAAAKGGTV